jgi:plastocyanin
LKAHGVCSLVRAGVAGLCLIAAAFAQSVNVTGHTTRAASSDVVIWLEPTGNTSDAKPSSGHFELVQKDKKFTPHVLVVPVGSSISFPNRDPFFHNVFSYFNGKRFDLGLYEAGSTRSVDFNRQGVSYIFCNIHPEMSAVIIALDTKYFSIANRGQFLLRDVPAGDYALHVWTDGADLLTPPPVPQMVHVARDHADLGEIAVPDAPAFSPHHKNKFGKDYAPPLASPY